MMIRLTKTSKCSSIRKYLKSEKQHTAKIGQRNSLKNQKINIFKLQVDTTVMIALNMKLPPTVNTKKTGNSWKWQV